MFLQTYIYYFAQAIYDLCNDGLSETSVSDTLLYGVEQLRKLCDKWKAFFAPAMLAGLGNHLETHEMPCWDEVSSTADCISFIANQCNDALMSHRAGKTNLCSWHLLMLSQFIETIATRHFEDLWYHRPTVARCVYFDKTDRYLTSFVPIETSTSPVLIPAVYTQSERVVVGIYTRAMNQAPSFVVAAGVDFEDKPKFIWADGSVLKENGASTWEYALLNGKKIPCLDIVDEILSQWERELICRK